MTTEQFKTIATEQLNKLSTSDLIIEVKKLVNDFSREAELVYDVVMDLLIERMPEDQYIQLCNSL
jgi:nitrogen regulatory protein PII-like uncharacterized protein